MVRRLLLPSRPWRRGGAGALVSFSSSPSRGRGWYFIFLAGLRRCLPLLWSSWWRNLGGVLCLRAPGLEDLRDGAFLRCLLGSVLCHTVGPIGWAAALPLPWSRGWQLQLPDPQVVLPWWCGGFSGSRSRHPGGDRGRRPTGTWSRLMPIPRVSSAIYGALFLIVYLSRASL
jgi:hypothetical protein